MKLTKVLTSTELQIGESYVMFDPVGSPQLWYCADTHTIHVKDGVDKSVVNLFCSRHHFDPANVRIVPVSPSALNQRILL
jgi:hypothetical protein